VWNKGFDQMVGHAPDESKCPPTGQSQRCLDVSEGHGA
jgi:hypothetical protein